VLVSSALDLGSNAGRSKQRQQKCCLINLYFSEWVITVQCQMGNFSALLWREQNTFWWDDDDDNVYFVLDQHAGSDFYSASSLKQYSSVDTSLHSGTLFWIRAHQSLLLILNDVCLLERQHFCCLCFDRPGFEPRSTALETSTLTNTQPVRLIIRLIIY
jgi:uncharacterized protein Veg